MNNKKVPLRNPSKTAEIDGMEHGVRTAPAIFDGDHVALEVHMVKWQQHKIYWRKNHGTETMAIYVRAFTAALYAEAMKRSHGDATALQMLEGKIREWSSNLGKEPETTIISPKG